MTMRTDRPGSRRATKAMARPSRSATSGVIGGSLATPRMPSGPNSLRAFESVLAGDFFLVTEVHELQFDAEVLSSHGLDTCLEIVPVLSADAHLRLVDGT